MTRSGLNVTGSGDNVCTGGGGRGSGYCCYLSLLVIRYACDVGG